MEPSLNFYNPWRLKFNYGLCFLLNVKQNRMELVDIAWFIETYCVKILNDLDQWFSTFFISWHM